MNFLESYWAGPWGGGKDLSVDPLTTAIENRWGKPWEPGEADQLHPYERGLAQDLRLDMGNPVLARWGNQAMGGAYGGVRGAQGLLAKYGNRQYAGPSAAGLQTTGMGASQKGLLSLAAPASSTWARWRQLQHGFETKGNEIDTTTFENSFLRGFAQGAR